MKMPLTIGVVHFVGIGGIGMSGIAEALHLLGYKVQGSDQVENTNVERLRKKGIKIFIGHKAHNIDHAEVVVISTAIRSNNVELRAARSRRIPVVKRSEMLAELMRFRQCISVGGTHGKTTTTSMIASLLDAGYFDPTVINGGIINAYGTNAYIGQGNWMVVEADESDGSFLKLPSDVVVVTNMDAEHLDYYGSYDDMLSAYRQFIENIPFYGLAVLCADHPKVWEMAQQIEDRRLVTYGKNPKADVVFSDYKMKNSHAVFDVTMHLRKKQKHVELKGLELPVPGIHNVSNATAAVTVAYSLGIGVGNIRKGLKSFTGVKRRFTKTGESGGISFYDDYAHHPVEIRSVLQAAKDICNGRVIAISQPHRYSRLSNLMDEFAQCFKDADSVIITPVYGAGEDPIEDINSLTLVKNIKSQANKDVNYAEDIDSLVKILSKKAKEGDFVICLGAGNITKWAYSLPELMK